MQGIYISNPLPHAITTPIHSFKLATSLKATSSTNIIYFAHVRIPDHALKFIRDPRSNVQGILLVTKQENILKMNMTPFSF